MVVLNKLKTYLAVVVTVAMVAGAYVLVDAIDKADDDRYLISVAWTPTAMHKMFPVQITVRVDGVALLSRSLRISPFSHTMTAEKGVVVGVTAVAGFVNTEKLDCIIMRNSRIVPRTGYDSRPNAGMVQCAA